ncbi:glycerol:H+ symporter, partial [Reticulomyxa filosa]
VKSNVRGSNPNAKPYLEWKYIVVYGLRWLGMLLLLEWLLHYMYAFYAGRFIFGRLHEMQTIENIPLFFSKLEWCEKFTMVTFPVWYVSYFLWSKFVVIWRFYRLWALIDGIYTIENMQRCGHHGDSVVDFWKYWHASFNYWNLRYLFLPLGMTFKIRTFVVCLFVKKWQRKIGGSKHKYWSRRVFNIIFVFAFTTLWHGDFTTSLVAWGALMMGWVIIELVFKQLYFFVCKKLRAANGQEDKNASTVTGNVWVDQILGSLGGVVCVNALTHANVVGFGPGFKATNFLYYLIGYGFILDNEFKLSVFLLLICCWVCVMGSRNFIYSKAEHGQLNNWKWFWLWKYFEEESSKKVSVE